MPFKDQRIIACIIGGLTLLSALIGFRYIFIFTFSFSYLASVARLVILVVAGTGLILYRRCGFWCLYAAFLLAMLWGDPLILIPYSYRLGINLYWLHGISLVVIAVAGLLHLFEVKTSNFASRPAVTIGEVLLPVGIGLITFPFFLFVVVVCEMSTIAMFMGDSPDMQGVFFVWGPIAGGGNTFLGLLGILGIAFHILHPLAALSCTVGFIAYLPKVVQIARKGVDADDPALKAGMSPVGFAIVLGYAAVTLTVSHPLILGLLVR